MIKIWKIIFFCENFLKFVKSVKNYENLLKKSKNQDFDDFQYQPPLSVDPNSFILKDGGDITYSYMKVYIIGTIEGICGVIIGGRNIGWYGVWV